MVQAQEQKIYWCYYCIANSHEQMSYVKFCIECGSEVKQYGPSCKKCGEMLGHGKESYKFCLGCGLTREKALNYVPPPTAVRIWRWLTVFSA